MVHQSGDGRTLGLLVAGSSVVVPGTAVIWLIACPNVVEEVAMSALPLVTIDEPLESNRANHIAERAITVREGSHSA
jgi:hypothetical protein